MNKRRIIVIEDNKDVRENLVEILTLANYDVLEAENGKRGVEMIISQKPDLILCDIMMPELDGFGVLHILNSNPEVNKIPFIFLTAKSEKEDLRKGMGLGADDYITKPFDDAELLQVIDLRLKKTDRLNAAMQAGTFHHNLSHVKSDDPIQQLIINPESRKYLKKETVIKEGSKVYFLYKVISGKLKSVLSNEDGKEKIIKIYKEGDYFGHIEMIIDQPSKENVVVLEDAEVAMIPKQQFLDMLHNHRDVAFRLIKLIARDHLDLEMELLKIAYNSVRKKVADALVSLYIKYGESNEPLRLLREDIAAYAGTAKETVIRTLSDFKSEKLIDIKDGKISILNVEKLKNMLN